MKKFLSLFLSAVLAVNVFYMSCVSYADEIRPTVVLCTSNIRGDIDIFSKVSALKKLYVSNGYDVILADSGNFLQGTKYASADKGKSVFDLMEATGYDVVNLGRYDFVFGNATMGAKPHGTLKQFLTLSQLFNGGSSDFSSKESSAIKSVCANAKGSNEYFTFRDNMTKSTVISTASGLKIGFAGVADPKVSDMVLEESLAGITFDNGKALYNDVSSSIENVNADYTICLSDVALDQKALKTDFFICVPSDKKITALVINPDGTSSQESIEISSLTSSDAYIESISSEIKQRIDDEFPVVYTSEVILNGSTRAVRSEETNLGDFWTDALRWYATDGGLENDFPAEYKENGITSLTVADEDVVSLWNGGNLRDFIYDGDVILQDIQRTLPYPNTVALAYVTGAQLVEALEASLQYDASFASVCGIEYNIDPMLPTTLGKQYPDSKYFAPTSKRVTIKSINGKPFKPEKKYAVITSNMIYNGGDTYSVFKDRMDDSVIISSKKVTDVVWAYVADALGGRINQPVGNRIHTVHKHSYKEYVTPAKIGKNGSAVTKCTICGEVKSKSTIYAVKSISLSKSSYAYSGDYKKPVVTIKDSKGNKLAGSNYSVKYSNNKKVGTATVKITLKGNYSGTKSINFTINPKSTSISKLVASAGSFTAKWKKQSVQTTGYQLRIATDSKFTKNKKTITVSKNTITSKKITKLSGNKKYYVQIRTYKTVNGKKYYSDWSKYKTVKTGKQKK